jgi:hypothetical protein
MKDSPKPIIWTILISVAVAASVLAYGMVIPNPIGNGHGVDMWPIIIIYGGILVCALVCLVAVPMSVSMLLANPMHRSRFNLGVTCSGAVLILLVLGFLARTYIR